MILLVLLLLVLAVLVASLALTVRHDGYGVLEPPRSHPRDRE